MNQNIENNANAAAKESNGSSNRGKNWSVDEDKQICRSWIDVISKGASGAEQQNTTFWGRVHQNYSSHNPTRIERSVASVQSRWGVIKRETVRYCIYLQEAEDSPASGSNEIIRAKKKYYDETKKAFCFDHCWEVLENVEIWKRLINKEATKKTRVSATSLSISTTFSRSSSMTSSSSGLEEIEPNNDKERSLNQRLTEHQVEKESRPEKRKLEELLSALLEEHKKKYIVSEEKIKVMTTSNDLQIMAVDIASLTDPGRIEFYKMAQEEVLERWRRNRSKH